MLQLGPACNAGGVEWTLSYEQLLLEQGERINSLTPGVKFAHELGAGWHGGGAVCFSYDGPSRRWQSAELRLPVSIS